MRERPRSEFRGRRHHLRKHKGYSETRGNLKWLGCTRGLRSIHGHIGEGYGRVRLGIGHPGHKDAVAGYVLHDFAKADADWLDDLLRGISDGAALLAAGEDAKFLNMVALQMSPPREATGNRPRQVEPATPKVAKPIEASPPELDNRSLLQRLTDRFS